MQFMKNNILGDEIICSGGFQIDSISAAHNYINPPHNYVRYATEHKNDRIIYIAEGAISFDMYNNKPFVANAGSAVYIPYNIAYKSEWLGNTRGEVYSINYVMTDIGGYQLTLSPEICLFEKCDQSILKGLFAECFDTFNRAEYAYLLKCKYLFLKLLFILSSLENGYGNSKVAKAIRYVDINYLSDISVKELAAMCNLGECMFRRCFKEETGISPLKYRNRLRIMHAYELLSENACSVAEAMELTGFYDASYFNKTFKLYTGKSPSECKSSSK